MSLETCQEGSSEVRRCSQARREANIRNARFSTGPRTARGKQVASANSYKHGRYARKPVVPAVEQTDFQEWRAAWLDRHQPDGPDETHLIESAALAAWKRERYDELEAVAINKRRRHADDQFHRERAARAEALGDDLLAFAREQVSRWDSPAAAQASPAALYRELCSFREGADWLLGQWRGLALVLAGEGGLRGYDRYVAALLAGKRPADALFDPELRELFLACAATGVERCDLWRSFHDAGALGDPKPTYEGLVETLQAERGYPDAASGLAALEALVQTHIARLEALKAESLDALAELDREDALALALFDDSKAGAALRRQQAALGREVSRALNDFLKLRRAAARGLCGNEPIPEGEEAEEFTPIEAADTYAEMEPEADPPPEPAPAASGAGDGNEAIAEFIPDVEFASDGPGQEVPWCWGAVAGRPALPPEPSGRWLTPR
jgi:hypothetical protein